MRQNHKSLFHRARGDCLSIPFPRAEKFGYDWSCSGLGPQDTYHHTFPEFAIQPGERLCTLLAAHVRPLRISGAAFVDTHEIDDADLFEPDHGIGS